MYTFTPIYDIDFITTPDQNPLSDSGNWTAGNPSFRLQVASGACEAVSGSTGDARLSGPTLPNDQYSLFTAGGIVESSNAYLRSAVAGTGHGGFRFFLFYLTSTIYVYNPSSSLILTIPVTFSSGDQFLAFAYGTTIGIYQNGVLIGSVTNASVTTGTTQVLAISYASTNSDTTMTYYEAGSVTTGYTVSGNCGAAGATINYSGTASGSVTADGSGNYSISSLANGTYVLTPSLSGYQFSQPSLTVVVNAVNVTGANFQAASAWSPVDSRVAPNMNRVENNSIFWDVQVGSNQSVPGKDSRANPPIDSDTNPPQNSRKAPPF